MGASMQYTDVMLDLETTGLDKQFNSIIQISAVKFNARTGEISHDFFNRSLLPAPNRYWEEGCRDWWSQRSNVLQGIMNRMEEPLPVLVALRDWAGTDTTMWAKPTHFDHAFLDTYYKQYGLQIPFNFRKANDLNSFIRGRYFPETPPNWEQELEFTGDLHNALHDVLHQLKVLFKVLEDTKK